VRHELVDKLKLQYMAGGPWYSLRWQYIEGCILKAYLDSYEQAGDEADFTFVKQFVDRLYGAHDSIREINIDYYSVDQLRMATVLFALYRREGEPKYKLVLDLLYGQLKTFPRTRSGAFWHKTNYPFQVWLDGLYMAQPFYIQYTKEFCAHKDYSDSLAQFKNARDCIYNEQKRLYSHAYDESRTIFWCDPVTGQSPNVWARALGWLAMALVDSLELLEGEPADTAPLTRYLSELIDDVLPHQHPSGMWYQVVDAADHPANYLESSGTLMLAYAMLKAARLGYLPQAYRVPGERAFDGTIERYLCAQDGEVRLGGICKSAGLGRHPELGTIRDGSLDYYIFGEEVVENNGHGVAPLLMAANEVKLLSRYSPPTVR
jgi:unsaturated rhamnogalacturonyl hydrolase